MGNVVYITNLKNTTTILTVDLTESPLSWRKVSWKTEHKNRKYVAFQDSLKAVGPHFDYMRTNQYPLNFASRDDKMEPINAKHAYLYNTTT